MGYACPVCDVPQQDGEHLANHLAFTAMTHGAEHESWLDEHVPEWSSSSPDELAARVTELAEEAEYEAVFEDTVHDHAGHDHDSLFGGDTGTPEQMDLPRSGRRDSLDADAQAVIEEAQALTREMLEDSDEDADDADEGDEA
ncbi:hypothetical protein GL213_02715 [Halogeometricum borinquense]|uniref:Uncharacterized protein n=1 Tax=Halogeometricum borinquense TaxID=60847 RepID=A0A6C0UPS1_9EURY|nr:DUF5810 domain-containing protein [Halogeometricum borinquense]QIB75879.1 hypothetical protein G3I44_17295 [Halogeometricum borinquense]QIQ75538.1 hypothetical protein GL213_02715 [Halogeometricum borinquense]